MDDDEMLGFAICARCFLRIVRIGPKDWSLGPGVPTQGIVFRNWCSGAPVVEVPHVPFVPLAEGATPDEVERWLVNA